MPPAIRIAREDLVKNFHKPLASVAKHLGVSQTCIKRVCREHGISRWPFRKVSLLLANEPPDRPCWTTRL
jgi:hypothetical protein